MKYVEIYRRVSVRDDKKFREFGYEIIKRGKPQDGEEYDTLRDLAIGLLGCNKKEKMRFKNLSRADLVAVHLVDDKKDSTLRKPLTDEQLEELVEKLADISIDS